MRRVSLAGLLVSAVAGAAPAPDAFLDTLPGTDAAPKVRATIVGETRLGAADCAITVDRVNVEGTSVAPYDPQEPIAIVIVFNDQEIWTRSFGVDDDEYDPDRANRLPLAGLEKAIDRHDFSTLGPASSEFAIVGYATGAEIVQPFTPLAKLEGAALEPRSRYRGRIGTDLVQGITAGIDLLERSKATRRALIVFGDGTDTNNEAAKAALPALAIRARRARIELFGIRYLTAISSDAEVLSELVPGLEPRTSHDGIATDLAKIVSRLTERETIVFRGDALAWDGKRHPVALDCPGLHLAVAIELPRWQRAERSRPGLAVYLLIGGAVLLGLGLVAKRLISSE